MDLRRDLVAQALMRPFMVVEGKIPLEPLIKFGNAGIVVEIQVFILDTPPEPFDEDVVKDASPAIHTDAGAGLRQDRGEPPGRELHSLIVLKISGVARCKAC